MHSSASTTTTPYGLHSLWAYYFLFSLQVYRSRMWECSLHPPYSKAPHFHILSLYFVTTDQIPDSEIFGPIDLSENLPHLAWPAKSPTTDDDTLCDYPHGKPLVPSKQISFRPLRIFIETGVLMRCFRHASVMWRRTLTMALCHAFHISNRSYDEGYRISIE